MLSCGTFADCEDFLRENTPSRHCDSSILRIEKGAQTAYQVFKYSSVYATLIDRTINKISEELSSVIDREFGSE